MTWEIWGEGYQATGEGSPARLWGTVEAETFEAACDQLIINDPSLKSVYNKRYSKSGKLRSISIWGCRLFDNKADASKTFG